MVYNIGMRRIDIDELAKILKDSDIEDGLTVLKDGEDAFTVLKYDDYQELLYIWLPTGISRSWELKMSI